MYIFLYYKKKMAVILTYSGHFRFLYIFFIKKYPIYSTAARGTDHPPFSNFLFTNLFSIQFLYFFIISSLFPYFNLFVTIFIQSYVNIKLHVSTLLVSIFGRHMQFDVNIRLYEYIHE